jgi:hypothetical protein
LRWSNPSFEWQRYSRFRPVLRPPRRPGKPWEAQKRFGLTGVWAYFCDRPAARTNYFETYASGPNGLARREVDRGIEIPTALSFVEDTKMVSPLTLKARIRNADQNWGSLNNLSYDVILTKEEEPSTTEILRFRFLQAIRSDGKIIARDGIYFDIKNPTAWQYKCRTSMSAEFQTVVKLRTLNWAMLLLGFAGIGFVSYRRRPTITNRKLGPAAKSSRVMFFNSWATVPEYTREATLPFLQLFVRLTFSLDTPTKSRASSVPLPRRRTACDRRDGQRDARSCARAASSHSHLPTVLWLRSTQSVDCLDRRSQIFDVHSKPPN